MRIRPLFQTTDCLTAFEKYGSPACVTSLKVAPDVADPTSMKQPVSSLNIQKYVYFFQDLETFMQNSEDGVIIFSLGSYVSTTDQSLADILGETFSQLPQRIIWKRRGKVPKNVPGNIQFMDAIPQNDLLGKSMIGEFYVRPGGGGFSDLDWSGICRR